MGLNVLVVDDSAVMRHLICRTLRMTGLAIDRLEQAPDGVVALECLDRLRFDIALVDINMPVMDGEELIDRMRDDARHRDIPVLVVSTECGGVRLSRLAPKVDGFVRKPFTPEQLSDQISLMVEVPSVG